jgi:predicted GNAT family N-acyltransferase
VRRITAVRASCALAPAQRLNENYRLSVTYFTLGVILSDTLQTIVTSYGLPYLPAYRSGGVSPMTAEIGIVFNKPNDRAWLPRLRAWMTTNGSLARLGIKVPVQPRNSLGDGFCWRAELPYERLLVTIGYSSRDLQEGREFVAGEPIILGDPPDAGGLNGVASATFLDGPVVVACRDVVPQIRKSLIRVALRNQVEIRSPNSDRELSDYFSLRYRVYDPIGFLREENRRTRFQWEIDHWDRTAVPLCAITREGRVIGCARLISSYGDEEEPYVSNIQSLLDSIDDPKLKELFRFPNVALQPFDVLMEFTGFRAHFRELVTHGKRVAEIGRVAVDPDHRGRFLSEALVDTAVSLAQKRSVSSIFLACSNQLAPLYERCGFKPVPNVTSDKFFNIKRPSIVMEKRI